jgi:hypothetical protein
MDKVRYKPLWLLEYTNNDGDIIESRLLTKNIPDNPERGLYSTGVFTTDEQIALGYDLFGTDKLREIYCLAHEATEELLMGLVMSWEFTLTMNKMRELKWKNAK